MVWTSLANLAIPLSAVATGPILARALGPDGRGQFAAILAPVALMTLAANFGVPEALTYFVATKRASIRSAARTGMFLGFAAGLIAFVVLVALSGVLLSRYDDSFGIFYALAATLPIIMGLGMLRFVAQGLGRFDLVNLERWSGVLSRLLLIAALAIVGHLTVTNALWATHGTALLATLALVPVIRAGSRAKETAPKAEVRPILSYGARTWIGTVSNVLILRLDQAMLAPLASARQLGYYAVAVSLAEVPAVALLAVRDVAFAAAADRSEPALVARTSRVVVLISVPICLIGVALASTAVPFVFGARFEPAVPMTQVLFLATVPSGLATVLSAALFSAERPGLASVAQGAGAAATVIALIALVPSMGGMGAAYASLAAYVLSAALMIAQIARTSDVRASDCLVPRATDVADLMDRVRGRLRGG